MLYNECKFEPAEWTLSSSLGLYVHTLLCTLDLHSLTAFIINVINTVGKVAK